MAIGERIVKAIEFFGSLRERRGKKVTGETNQDWPEAIADVFDWIVIDADQEGDEGRDSQVRGTLAFTLDGERHYGLVYSDLLTSFDAKVFVRQGAKPSQMKIRYDPADPDTMIATPSRDEFPFDVWNE